MKYSIYILEPLLHAAEQLGVKSGKVTGCKIHAPSLKSERIWRHELVSSIHVRRLLCLPACPGDGMPNVWDVLKGVCKDQTEGQGAVG